MDLVGGHRDVRDVHGGLRGQFRHARGRGGYHNVRAWLPVLDEKHLAKRDPKWEGILKSGVYHIHKELGVDESVMWGEYFFVEALERGMRPF